MKVLSWDVGLRTLSYCLIETVEGSSTRFHIIDWDSIDVQVDNDEESAPGTIRPSKRIKTAAVSIEQGARLIMDALHRRAAVLAEGVDAIIIEQQPAGGHNQQSNVRMKVMSHAIQCYFYTRAIVGHTFIIPTITFVPANSKFCEKPKASRNAGDDSNDTADGTSEPTDAQAAPSRYSQNKKYAVVKTRELLEANVPAPGCPDLDNDKARLMFESITTKKKDDLADSFLLGFYYLRKQAAGAAPKVKRARANRTTKHQQAGTEETTAAAAPTEAAPMEAAPTEAAPMEAAPTEAAPMEAAAVKRARAKPTEQQAGTEETTAEAAPVKRARAPKQLKHQAGAEEATAPVKRARATKPIKQQVDGDNETSSKN
jgi:hypothetical protein